MDVAGSEDAWDMVLRQQHFLSFSTEKNRRRKGTMILTGTGCDGRAPMREDVRSCRGMEKQKWLYYSTSSWMRSSLINPKELGSEDVNAASLWHLQCSFSLWPSFLWQPWCPSCCLPPLASHDSAQSSPSFGASRGAIAPTL